MRFATLYNLFVQTALMQFSPSLLIYLEDCVESVLKPLLRTKYFTRTLQRCVVFSCVNNGLLLGLSKVQSLTNFDLRWNKVENEHLETIINTFPSLETLTIYDAQDLKISSIYSKTALFITSPPPPATKTLRSLTMHIVDPLFATTFVPHFTNLRKLVLGARDSSQELDLRPLFASLPLVSDLVLRHFDDLKNTDSLRNLVHLSTLQILWCRMTDLRFLTEENNLPHLTTLCINRCDGLSTSSSFASLSHAPNLRVLGVNSSKFDNDCLQYLENMIHLRKLDLSRTEVVGDSRAFKTLMQNLFQLEELNLSHCQIGNQGSISGALFNNHSRLRVLNLEDCYLVDDDLNGIGALKNTLEELDLGSNVKLTNESLVYCKDLAKLKSLQLELCSRINDLTPLKDCLNLEDLNMGFCKGLTDGSFNVFSEEPNSFPNLRVLALPGNEALTEVVVEHLSKNNHLVYQLKELDVERMSQSDVLLSSPAARNSLYQLKGLRELPGFLSFFKSESEKDIIEDEVMRNLKNLDEIA